jgi:3-hydroxyacyl-CoA dehydrogenase
MSGPARVAARTTADGICVIIMSNPPVNALNQALRRSLLEAVTAAAADPTIRAIVLSGEGSTFSAGADLREFGTTAAVAAPSPAELVAAIDASPKPVIAAIDGFALGGGLELALGCHRRTAAPAARVGLPEVKLGLIPGAGGTARLPRAIGLGAAADLISSGRIVAAEDPALAGLFDAIGPEPAEAALALARNGIDLQSLSDRPLPATPDPVATLGAIRQKIGRRLGNPAVAAALDALDAGLDSIAAALTAEQTNLDRLLATPEPAALSHAFLAERDARHIPDLPPNIRPRPIERVAIVGAGRMGRELTAVLLKAGLSVLLICRREAALAEVRSGLGARAARLDTATEIAAAASADLVIESVVEDYAAKLDVLATLDRTLGPDAIIATNTSTLDVNRLAAATSRPDRVLGLHFFSPAQLMRLVEVVRGRATSHTTLATGLALARRLGKMAVVAGVCEGFIGNRMLEEYLRQTYFLLDEGALPHEVDQALEDWGMAMGPLRMMDMAGNDIGAAVRQRLSAEHPERISSTILDIICDAGRLGQKAGRGFYRYAPGSRKPEPDPEVEAMILDYARTHGIKQRRIPPEEIVERCVFALVNEGARILEEGIALRPGDIDVVYLVGYGFPPTRGGPMHYANHIGLRRIVETMRRFSAGYQGWCWTPAPLLERLAAAGARFA